METFQQEQERNLREHQEKMERVRQWILSCERDAEGTNKRKREDQNHELEPENKRRKEEENKSEIKEYNQIRKSETWRNKKSKIYLHRRNFEGTFNSCYWFKWRAVKQEDDD